MTGKLSSIGDVDAGGRYSLTSLKGLRFSDGRYLVDALRSSHFAPEHEATTKINGRFAGGKFYLGSDLVEFWHQCESGDHDKISGGLYAEAKRLAAKIEQMRGDIREAERLMQKAQDWAGEHVDDVASLGDYIAGRIAQSEGVSRIHSAKPICGVYFLIGVGGVVYVGQSTNVINRITQHQASHKRFDRFTFMECRQEALDEVELFFIKLIQPRYNVRHLECGSDFPAPISVRDGLRMAETLGDALEVEI